MWKILTLGGCDDKEALGFLALYVDDMAVVGEHDVVTTLLDRIRAEWKCSAPEFVTECSWVKFRGFVSCRRRVIRSCWVNALMHKTFCLNILEWFAKALIFLELWTKSLTLM